MWHIHILNNAYPLIDMVSGPYMEEGWRPQIGQQQELFLFSSLSVIYELLSLVEYPKEAFIGQTPPWDTADAKLVPLHHYVGS